jgi:hypothetical protein
VNQARARSVVIGCAALLLTSLLTSTPVGAAPPRGELTKNCTTPADTVPPTVTSLHLSPRTVSVRQGPAVIHVTAHVNDTMSSATGTDVPGSGVRKVTVDLWGQRYALEFGNLHLASGTADNGVWRGRVDIAEGEDPSTWYVGNVEAVDAAGNTRYYGGDGGTRPIEPDDTSLQPGWDTTFVVQGAPRPETLARLASLTVHPRVINTTTTASRMSVTAHIRGPIEPPRTLAVAFLQSRSDIELGAWLTHRHGNVYSATVTIPRWLGTHRFRSTVYANYFWDDYDSRIVRGNAVRPTIHVTSELDASAPRLDALTVTPHRIDTTQQRQRITVTASITDAQSGVANVPGLDDGEVIDLQGSHFGDYGEVNLHRSGNRWIGSGWIQRCAGSSTWRLSAEVTDRAGNFRDYSSSQLAADGFPSSVVVTSKSPGDVLAPTVTNDEGPTHGDVIPLHFSEDVRNVTPADLSVYKTGMNSGDYAHPLAIKSVTCSGPDGNVACSGAAGPIRSARVTVPGIQSGKQYEVWANQGAVVPQLTDLAGNPLNWEGYAASFYAQ